MLSFAKDIRPLFRQKDIDSMKSLLDLADYQSVTDNATAIYEQVKDGTMPCDGAWPADNVTRFKQWMDEGFSP